MSVNIIEGREASTSFRGLTEKYIYSQITRKLKSLNSKKGSRGNVEENADSGWKTRNRFVKYHYKYQPNKSSE